MSVRTLLPRTSAVFWALVVIAWLAGAGDRPHDRYPNELQAFRFYAEYLAPLEPGLSMAKAVRRLLGDTAAVRRNGWTMNTTYAVKGGPAYNPTLGPLSGIILRPDEVIPMAAMRFPPRFAHCRRSVSEFNISFDVYSDTSGLQYWLNQEDSKWGIC